MAPAMGGWALGLDSAPGPTVLGPQAYFAAVMRIRCACAVRYARLVLVAPFLLRGPGAAHTFETCNLVT